jgi:hypothetical protein
MTTSLCAQNENCFCFIGMNVFFLIEPFSFITSMLEICTKEFFSLLLTLQD